MNSKKPLPGVQPSWREALMGGNMECLLALVSYLWIEPGESAGEVGDFFVVTWQVHQDECLSPAHWSIVWRVASRPIRFKRLGHFHLKSIAPCRHTAERQLRRYLFGPELVLNDLPVAPNPSIWRPKQEPF